MKTFSLIFILFFCNLLICPAKSNENVKAIDTTEIVSISNTKQVIRIKGTNTQNPVLLYLNGGPGDSVLDEMDNMFGVLQKKFIVILWDQRNSGKTSALKNENVRMTQKLFKNDTYEIVQYLLKKFNKRKIFLVAHSYGTTLGFDIARNHPELLHAYIAVSPLTNQIKSELIALEMLKDNAQKNKNDQAINELSKVTVPFKSSEELYYDRKWLFDFEGKAFARKEPFRQRVLSWSSTWLDLFNESIQENLFESTKKIECPVFFIVGENDYQTNSKLSHEYFNLLQAPQKEIFSFKNAGHLIPYEHQIKFQKTITEVILPSINLINRG